EKTTHSFLKKLHSSLMFNTTLHSRGMAGIYKTIPNMILGTNADIAQPFEVEPKLDELIEWYYNQKEITMSSIAEFHYRFELIHPFQDGNGRIGRFLMLKQMLENNLPVKIVSWDNEDLYRNSLGLCSIGDYTHLIFYLEGLEDFREVYKMLWK
ncbi:Fic family protein, partial [Clostridioides difficile]